MRGHPLQRLVRDVDSLFGRLWSNSLVPLDTDVEPLRVWDLDVREDGQGGIVVRAEIPGFEEDEIDVQINGDVLTIRAEEERSDDARQEIRTYYRAISLPSGIDPGRVQATYRNGVLELHIPRAQGAQPKRIPIQGQQAASGQQGQQSAGGRQGQQGAAGRQSQQAGSQQSGTSSQPASQGQHSGSQTGAAAPEKAKA